MKLLKILTLNAWQERGPWKLRWKVIFENIKQIKPDIIGFQEVFNPDWAQEVKRKSKFPYLVFHPEPSGLMILSQLVVRQSACLTIKTQSPTEDYGRYALFAEIEWEKNKGLGLFNTHLSWQLDEGVIREKQVGELLVFIHEKADKKDAVVMGDFNAIPFSPEVRTVVEAGGFVDTFGALNPKPAIDSSANPVKVGGGDSGFTWSNDNPYARQSGHPMPDRRIDYIFVRRESGVLPEPVSSEIVMNRPSDSGIWASDHFAVMTTFAFA